jgi:hypothetical protein
MSTATSMTPTPVFRRLDTDSANVLVNLSATFEDLQTVLRCCEDLVAELLPTGEPLDDVLIEALWTTALISYARTFSSAMGEATLTEKDLAKVKLKGEVLEWHEVLLKLHEHYTSPMVNPRELFLVGVSQNADGAADGIAITGARQPLVEDATVRQTGGIVLALSDMVSDRIIELQEKMLGQFADTPKAVLDRLPILAVEGDVSVEPAE